jgi:flagellar protein FlaI
MFRKRTLRLPKAEENSPSLPTTTPKLIAKKGKKVQEKGGIEPALPTIVPMSEPPKENKPEKKKSKPMRFNKQAIAVPCVVMAMLIVFTPISDLLYGFPWITNTPVVLLGSYSTMIPQLAEIEVVSYLDAYLPLQYVIVAGSAAAAWFVPGLNLISQSKAKKVDFTLLRPKQQELKEEKKKSKKVILTGSKRAFKFDGIAGAKFNLPHRFSSLKLNTHNFTNIAKTVFSLLPLIVIGIMLVLSRTGVISKQIFLLSGFGIVGVEFFLYIKERKRAKEFAEIPELETVSQPVQEEPMIQQKIKLEPSYLDSTSEVPRFVAISESSPATSQYYTVVVKDPTAESGLRYTVVEPSLSDADKANFDQIKKILINELTVDLNKLKTKEEAEEFLKSKILEVIEKYRLQVPKETLPKIYYYAVRDYIKMGKLEPLLHDHMIEDISCDGVGVPLYIWHREYESIPTNVMFETEKELDDFVMKMAYRAGRHISLATPIVDASLPDGSRVQLTYGYEVTKKGSTFTIRKFRADPLTVVDLIIFNTMSADIAAYLWYMVEKRLTLLVAGGTASGKTTTLNGIGTFITPGQKVVSIEDTQEINLPHENWIPAVSRQAFISGEAGEITLFDLLRASLRQRPDIIIVGEVRGAEAYTLFQAMATGHGGFSSIHADSINATITRLTSEPMKIPQELISNSLDLVLLQLKLKLGTKSVRRVLQVAEIVGVDEATGEFVFNDAFKWDPARDLHVSTGRSIAFEKIRKRYGERMEHITHEINKRKAVLEWMVRHNIRRHKEVSDVIAQFYANPEGFYEKIRMSV